MNKGRQDLKGNLCFKKNYVTKKTNVYHIHDTETMDRHDLNEKGPRNKKNYENIPAIIDNLNKLGWKIQLKKKLLKHSKIGFDNILISSERKPY